MGSMVEDRVRKACSVIESKDIKLSKKIIQTDWEIDEMEIEIEEECLKIMALYQPVAKDLRFLVTVIKINNEMERIGDYAVQIAKRVKRLSTFGSPAFSYNFQEMTDKVMRELRMSIDALVDRDVQIAKQIFSLDQEINDLRSEAYKMIIAEMGSTPDDSTSLLNLYLVVRHLERIADRATNIAEDVIYMVEGEIVRKKRDFELN
jgi:phosphate transport system protein